jgi:hypothetical protein
VGLVSWRLLLVALVVALVAAVVGWRVTSGPDPFVPASARGSLTFAHAEPGQVVGAQVDRPVDSGLTTPMTFQRWTGRAWGTTAVDRGDGTWSTVRGDVLGLNASLSGRTVTTWTFRLPAAVASGTYLACDPNGDCGLLEVD